MDGLEGIDLIREWKRRSSAANREEKRLAAERKALKSKPLKQVRWDDATEEAVNQVEFVATDAAPGSAEKIAVLRYRVENSLPLWHEDDLYDSTPSASDRWVY